MKKFSKHRILPLYGIIYSIFLILLLFLTCLIIEIIIPKYSNWQKENDKILNVRKDKLDLTLDYPYLDYSETKLTKNEKRILIIGDSYLQGSGYTNINDTYFRQLQLELYNRGYYDATIYAVGKFGASTYDELKFLTDTNMIKEINPDLIIMGYVMNDPELDDKKGKPLVPSQSDKNYFKKNAILKKINRIFPNITYKINDSLNEKYSQSEERRYDIIVNDYWSKKYDEVAVQPLGKYLNSLNIPSFVVTLPNKLSENVDERYKVLDLFKKSQITTYNTVNYLRNIYQQNPTVYEKNTKINLTNSHPGTFYTKYYAQYLANILEKNYKSSLGKKYSKQIDYKVSINDYIPSSIEPILIKQTEDYSYYQINYPKDKFQMLRLPINKSYLKLNLEFPVELSKITVKTAASVKCVSLYLTYIDDLLGYDSQQMFKIGKSCNDNKTFIINNHKKVTSINIAAKTKNNTLESTMLIKISK